jgi:hypothetical protein
MNLKLKSLVAAMAMFAASATQAAIVTDGWGGGAGGGTGTGDGELFLSIYDPTVSQSLVLDLNLTVNDFRLNNASLINTFSVTDATLQGFISASSDQSLMRWNIGGLSNLGFGADLGVLTTHGSAGATFDVGEQPFDGNGLFVGMNNLESYANLNPTTAVVGANTAGGHQGGYWAGTMGGALFVSNEHVGFGGGEWMSFIHVDPSNILDGAPIVDPAFASAQWMVNPTSGTVSYVGEVSAVPVPAAVWLFGSGLLGLVGVSRRRKQA